MRLVMPWVMKMYFEMEIPKILRQVMMMIRTVINPRDSRIPAIFATRA